eukprot:s2209_g8.t1
MSHSTADANAVASIKTGATRRRSLVTCQKLEDISPEQLQSILANNKADLGTLWTLCEKLQSFCGIKESPPPKPLQPSNAGATPKAAPAPKAEARESTGRNAAQKAKDAKAKKKTTHYSFSTFDAPRICQAINHLLAKAGPAEMKYHSFEIVWGPRCGVSGMISGKPAMSRSWFALAPAPAEGGQGLDRFLAVSYPRDIIENLKKYGFPLGQGTALATLPEALATGSLMMKLGGSFMRLSAVASLAPPQLETSRKLAGSKFKLDHPAPIKAGQAWTRDSVLLPAFGQDLVSKYCENCSCETCGATRKRHQDRQREASAP